MDIDKLKEDLAQNKFSPENMFYRSLEALDTEDITPSTAGIPLTALLEHQVAGFAVNNNELDVINRSLSVNYADTYEGIARHLDYSTLPLIHATPSNNKVTLGISVAEIVKYGYKLSDGTIRIVIPEDTYIVYDNTYYYGIHHAIDIRYIDQDTINVNYIDNDNPLFTLDNPVIEIQYRETNDLTNGFATKILELELNVYQFKRVTSLYPITSGVGFTKTFTLDNQYYHARVFTNISNTWVELDTYFSEFIYDSFSDRAAAVVKLSGNKVTIDIPQIFFNRNLIGSEVKVSLYTTHGDIELDHSLSVPNDFTVNFENNDSSLSLVTAPLESLTTIYAYSTTPSTGGADIPDLATLKQIVLSSNIGDIPVTDLRLENKLNLLGYNLVKEHNYISDNLYLASRKLRPITSVGGTQLDVSGGGFDLLLQSVTDKYGVKINDTNYTITPEAVFSYDNGIITLLTTGEVNTLRGYNTLESIEVINNGNYLSSPFYYLIDRSESITNIKAFDLESPNLIKRRFIGSNDNNIGLINTKSVIVTKVDTGYTIDINAVANDTFLNYSDNAFIPQITVTDSVGRSFSLNGTFTGRGEDGSYNYQFDLTSNLDLSYLGTIIISSLTGIQGSYEANLEDTFNLTYNLIERLPANLDSYFKNFTDSSKLPNNYQVVTYETINIKLGEMLKNIYTPCTSYLGSTNFKKYTDDVPAYYSNDIYELDEFGYMVWTKNPDYVEGGEEPPILYNKLYDRGEPIVDDQGNPVYAHRKGDIVLDSKGDPIPENRDLSQIETKLILIDYKFTYSTGYLSTIRTNILNDLVNDINSIANTMLGLTELNYSIARSTGLTSVRYDSVTKGSLNSNLSFEVNVTVDNITYKDGSLRQLIGERISNIIANYVRGTTKFAINTLIKQIDNDVGSDVVSFDISKINGRDDIVSFELLSPTDTLSIKPILTLGGDNTTRLSNDINVMFKLAQ